MKTLPPEDVLFVAYAVFAVVLLVLMILDNFWFQGESIHNMRARLLADLLETDPEKRSERILDLCFYVVSDKAQKSILKDETLPEILQHLEQRIRQAGMVRRESGSFRSLMLDEVSKYESASRDTWIASIRNPVSAEEQRYWDIPTLERPMGFEKEIERVEKFIQEYKERKAASEENEGQKCEDESVSRRKIPKCVDLEQGLEG